LKRQLLTVQKIAEDISRSTDFVRDEIKKRRLSHLRIGGRLYVTEDDLAAYLERSRVAAYGERPAKRSCTNKEAGA